MKRLKALWALIGILLVWFVFSSDYFIRGLVPFPTTYLVSFFPPWNAYNGMPVKNGAMPDLITQLYPWRHLTIESWKKGEVPLWNPYSFSGTQHAGNYQSAPFSPFNSLFLVLPEIDAWSLLVLLQPLLAGLFMYLFVRTLGNSRVAGVMAALSFMFCGFAVVWMGYGTLVHAVLWLPLILMGVHGFVTSRKWIYAVLIPFGIAASLVSGHFQISLYVLGFTIAYCIYVPLAHKQKKYLLQLAALVVLGIVFALPQLVPAFTAYSQSSRSANFWNHGSIPFRYLITMVAPDFYGNPVTRNDWFGQYAEWASFAGVIPLILALYASIRKRGVTIFFTGAAVFSLLLATPTPLNSFLYWLRIPVLSTSAGSRIIVLFSFSVAVLSAIGLDSIANDWKKNVKKPAIIVISVAGGFFFILWLTLLAGTILPPDKLAIAVRNSILPSFFAGAAVLILISGFIKIRKISFVFLLPILLLFLTGADSVRYAKKWMPFESREYMFPRIDVIQFLQTTAGGQRIYGTFGNELITYFGLASIEGYDAVYQSRYGEFISAAGDGNIGTPQRSVVSLNKNGKYAQTYLDLLGVRYLVHRVSDGQQVWAYPFWKFASEYVQVYKDPQYEVYENTRAFPRARLASGYQVQIHPQEILSLLLSEEFPRDTYVILEQKPGLEPMPGEGSVTTVSETPNTLTLVSRTSVPKLLYVADVYETGWRAYVDGKEVPVYRANFAFRAIDISPGEHEIIFVYKPASVHYAIFVSVGSMVVFLFLAGRKVYEHSNSR